MHCCLSEPDYLAGIMLLFQRDRGTQHADMAMVSVSVKDLKVMRDSFIIHKLEYY